MRAGSLIRREAPAPTLVQEASGIHVGISPDLPAAALRASATLQQRYSQWRSGDRLHAWGAYKRDYFTIAVGGGNTMKSQYLAWLNHRHSDIDWLGHVRFFFLEDSTGEPGWESAEQSLVINFLEPLTRRLCQQRGRRRIARKMHLADDADVDSIVDAVVARLCNPINLAPARQALDAGRPRRALNLARSECARYQRDICDKLGATMSVHCVVSGVGKDGTLGALSPYRPELAIKSPNVLLLKQDGGALRAALSRGVIINAEFISLIVSGSLKLKALGRLEMDEVTEFEQTVMETPLRMLRESWDIADRVFIFADETALHFAETVFEYSDQGERVKNKAETRHGDEDGGIHALLIHGFLGLFSFANLLIRLPSSWTVSALHRGSRAKFLPSEDIFPHYARVLRKAVLKIWRQGRPVPIAGHSIAGLIMDHLLLTLLPSPDAPVPDYAALGRDDRDLVDALRASGIIHLATWSPCDGPNTGENVKSLVSHLRSNTDLDYSGFPNVYRPARRGPLQPLHADALADSADSLARLDRFLQRRLARPLVNSMNLWIRAILNNRTVQQRMLNAEIPYVMRLVGGRLLKTVSLYGLLKEINAGLHDPVEYQRRHLKALDIVLAYDIPFLSIVHEDDFLVSAGRHKEEYRYLLRERMRREGVTKASAVSATVRYVPLQRITDELPMDPLNPHLLVMSTNTEGNHMARQITAAMTRFVNENVARAAQRKAVKPLPSVRRWQRKQRPKRRGTQKLA